MIICVQVLGISHSKNFGGQNMTKIRRDFGQLQMSIANISGTDKDIDKEKKTSKIWRDFGQL